MAEWNTIEHPYCNIPIKTNNVRRFSSFNHAQISGQILTYFQMDLCVCAVHGAQWTASIVHFADKKRIDHEMLWCFSSFLPASFLSSLPGQSMRFLSGAIFYFFVSHLIPNHLFRHVCNIFSYDFKGKTRSTFVFCICIHIHMQFESKLYLYFTESTCD